MRMIALTTCLVLAISSCGGSDELTLSEYAVEVEALTNTMYRQLEDVSIPDSTRFPTVQEFQTVYHGVAAAYRGLLDGLTPLDPPEEAAGLHETSLDIITELVSTHDALANRADEVESADELQLLWDSPEQAAAEVAQEKVMAFCRHAQRQFDAAAERDLVVFDGPWIPVELEDVVKVVFGCGPRGPDSAS